MNKGWHKLILTKMLVWVYIDHRRELRLRAEVCGRNACASWKCLGYCKKFYEKV